MASLFRQHRRLKRHVEWIRPYLLISQNGAWAVLCVPVPSEITDIFNMTLLGASGMVEFKDCSCCPAFEPGL